MRTAKLLVWLLVLFIASGSVTFAGDVAVDVAESTERGDLSILYAGYPGGPREKAWTEFLRQWFAKVESIDLGKLNGRSAADFHVVVADWTSRYKDADVDLKLEAIEKWAFYDAVATNDHVLTIQTADQQRYANILLTIGVRMD